MVLEKEDVDGLLGRLSCCELTSSFLAEAIVLLRHRPTQESPSYSYGQCLELFKLSYSTLQTFLISRLKKVVVIFSKKLLVKLIEKPVGIHAAVSCCSQFLNTVEVR